MRIPKTDVYPISAAQKILLWSEVFTWEPRKVKQNNIISFYMRVKENGDKDALTFAFNELIKRNDSLRLRLFRTLKGIKQYIADYKYTELDCIKVDGDEGFQEYLKEISQLLVKFFDEKLYWAQLVKCGKDDYALILRIHHAAIDGYSIRLIADQIEKYYNAKVNNEKLDDKIYSVLEYFKIQKKYRESKSHDIDKKYWMDKFFHQRKLSFPAGYRSERGDCASEYLSIENDTYVKLKKLAAENKCTMQFLLMSLAAVTVYSITGKENFIICFPSHGRLNYKLKNTIGCIMNLVSIFYDIDKNMTFDTMIKTGYPQYLEYLSHGRLSMNEIVPMSYYEAVKHFFNFNPSWLIFSSMEFGNKFEHSKYEMKMIQLRNQPTQFYLSMLDIENERVDFDLSYQTRKFKPEKVKYLLRVYSFIIEYSINNPSLSIEKIKSKYEEEFMS